MLANEYQIIAPSPGFNALRFTPQKWELRKFYKQHCGVTILISYLSDKEITKREAEDMVKKLDRIHDFYCGQAVGFLFATKNILANSDPFHPGEAMNRVNEQLKAMAEDLDRYTKMVQNIPADQIKLELA